MSTRTIGDQLRPTKILSSPPLSGKHKFLGLHNTLRISRCAYGSYGWHRGRRDSTRLASTRRGARLKYSRSICTPNHFQVIACYTLPAPLYLSKGSFITSETRGGKEIGCFINRAFPLLFSRRSIFHARGDIKTRDPRIFSNVIRQKSGRYPNEYLKGARKGKRKSENYGGPARAVHAITNLHRQGNV